MTQTYSNLVVKRGQTPKKVTSTPSTNMNNVARKKKNDGNKALWVIPVLALVVSTAASYFLVFKPTTLVEVKPEGTTGDENTGSLLSTTGPKTEACPLNGKLYTAEEKSSWEKRRPIAVMVENTPDARPQSGLTSADIVYETVAEGGITRFMGLFYCGVQANDTVIAPVRSARTYYVNLASGYNYPLYVHVGGANVAGRTNALGQLDEYGWRGNNDIDGMSAGYPTFIRNYNRIPGREIATEHTMETYSEEIYKLAAKRGWTNMSKEMRIGKKTVPASDWKAGFTPWKFVTGTAAGNIATIKYGFWSGYTDYDVTWKYDSATNTYKRFQTANEEKHIDSNNNEQIAASNVVIIYAKEEGPLNEKAHLLYDVIGTGDGVLFRNGERIDIKWSKKDREAAMLFTDSKGKDIELTAGQVWVSVLDTANESLQAN